ncbi:MAG TPA: tetratricopeptide repeat protein [Anaeromyxobacteraceae bacterium]|nr:tetratricopeptide repeat protein [Anaeromyxobacteraceae bacterium]
MTARRLQLGLAAAAFWAAALPSGARGAPAGDPERRLAELRAELQLMEQEHGKGDEPAAQRARRKFSEGESQFQLGDWAHSVVLLHEAVDDPAFRGSRDHATALYYLGESAFQQGDLYTARGYFRQVTADPRARFRREALTRLLDLALRLGTLSAVDALLAEGERTFAGAPPPEFRYLAAKATWRRRDLDPAARAARALRAFAEVPPPYHLAAAYFRGAIQVEAMNLPAAAEAFEGCARLAAADAAQRQIRELCQLGLGRVYAEMGRYPEAIDRYQEVPRESGHFEEALHEMGWTLARAGRYQQALRMTSLMAELAPRSALAPENAILQGHLQLKLGRYPDAVDSYRQVTQRYGPALDQVDAVLARSRDATRCFDEIVGRGDPAPDSPALLPPVAARWAGAQPEMARARAVLTDLDGASRDLAEGQVVADRLEVRLSRGDGLDAFPRLQNGWARADAIENGVALLDGDLAGAAEAMALEEKSPSPERRAAVERARASRLALEPRARRLPRTGAEAVARLDAIRARFAEIDRAAFRLGYDLESAKAALAGAQASLAAIGDDSAGGARRRAEVLDEMRRHREAMAGYERALRRLRQDAAVAADAIAGHEGAAGDAAVREGYRRAVAASWEALGRAGGALGVPDRERLEWMGRMRSRFPELVSRAARLKEGLRGAARAAAPGLRARVQGERERMAQQLRDLARVQKESEEVLGRVATQSLRAVRKQFHELVQRADLGLADVSWQRKRAWLDTIQELSTAKAADLSALEEEFGSLLREVQ